MSEKSNLVKIGAFELKLNKFYYSLFIVGHWCMLFLCCSSVSMPLRPKRTCSGVECFGGFHITRFIHLFIFLREAFT